MKLQEHLWLHHCFSVRTAAILLQMLQCLCHYTVVKPSKCVLKHYAYRRLL
jgi:hypothetical protein